MESNAKNLEFLKTYTVEQFKHNNHVDKIRIKQNPKTGYLFFTFGGETGAVAKAGVPKNPMISKVKGEPTELNPSGEFYLLHEEGMGGAIIIDTL